MPLDPAADETVSALRSAVSAGAEDLANIPGLLRIILKHEFWRCRFVRYRQTEIEFPTFTAFVIAPAPEGLGTTVETLKRFCKSAGDLEAVDMIDRAVVAPQGAPPGNQNAAKSEALEDAPKTKLDNIKDCLEEKPWPDGTSTEYALRKLRKDAPDLHEKVLANELTPNAAMVEAGFRMKTHTIPHDPVRAADALRRIFTDDELVVVAERLLTFL